jgi:septal ring factor EnvC (AmiA/AmiB activator)
VHDIEELDNLLNHEKRAEQTLRQTQSSSSSEMEELRRKELERQRELNALEERAKSARESAAAFTGTDSTNGTEPTPHRTLLVSTRNLADVRKGFIWAKVLDEPRFKRRWSAQYR